MSLASFLQISDQDVRTTSKQKGGELFGQTAGTSDGRVFAYGNNGTGSGTALAPGKLNQGATVVANHINQTGVTASIGTNSLTYTVGSTEATTNEYQDGYFYVNTGTGVGQNLRVAGNTDASSTNSYSITVNLHDALTIATSVSDSKFSLQPNPWSKAVIAASSSPTAVIPVGVLMVSLPDAYYGWFQIGGPSSVLINGTPGVGFSVIPSATTDGAVDVDGTSSVQPKVGYMLSTGVSTQDKSVFLTIPTA